MARNQMRGAISSIGGGELRNATASGLIAAVCWLLIIELYPKWIVWFRVVDAIVNELEHWGLGTDRAFKLLKVVVAVSPVLAGLIVATLVLAAYTALRVFNSDDVKPAD
jgi:ABC-type arginine transport system permease subunit